MKWGECFHDQQRSPAPGRAFRGIYNPQLAYEIFPMVSKCLNMLNAEPGTNRIRRRRMTSAEGRRHMPPSFSREHVRLRCEESINTLSCPYGSEGHRRARVIMRQRVEKRPGGRMLIRSVRDSDGKKSQEWRSNVKVHVIRAVERQSQGYHLRVSGGQS